MAGEVAHPAMLQPPWCVTTSHWNVVYDFVIMLQLSMVCHNKHQDCFEQQVKLPLFIKHALSISIVGLSLGITSLYET